MNSSLLYAVTLINGQFQCRDAVLLVTRQFSDRIRILSIQAAGVTGGKVRKLLFRLLRYNIVMQTT